jgi:hypothetical protein
MWQGSFVNAEPAVATNGGLLLSIEQYDEHSRVEVSY